MKMKKMKKMKGHTGPIRHADMKSYGMTGMGGKDPMAHESHHAANAEHNMPEGMSPVGGYDGAQGGGCMDGNCESED